MIRRGLIPTESGEYAASISITRAPRLPARLCFAAVLACAFVVCGISGHASPAESFDKSPPIWEPLLWGGKITVPDDRAEPRYHRAPEKDGEKEPKSVPSLSVTVGSIVEIGLPPTEQDGPPAGPITEVNGWLSPNHLAAPGPPVLVPSDMGFPRRHCMEPLRKLSLKSIPPLYLDPPMKEEGMWDWKHMPVAADGWPTIYKTTYRPSVEYPNAVVHMLLFDMEYLKMRLYIGSAERFAPSGTSMIEPENKATLLAITNGLWKQRHAKEGGAIFRGEVLEKMVPGLATIVNYKDDSVDVLEWKDGLSLSSIRDARQLKHLIVKDGKVVERVVRDGKRVDSEIGLGLLLSDESPSPYYYWYGGYPYSASGAGAYGGHQWFIATRSAFGIRKDGNLVFALGHHISTKDLAKALVLAGCVRAIHGDANPHNVVGNLYYTDGDGIIVKKARLSPDQKTYTLNRYVDRSYTSDFFAFYSRFHPRAF